MNYNKNLIAKSYAIFVLMCCVSMSCTHDVETHISGNVKNAAKTVIVLEEILPLGLDSVTAVETENNGDFDFRLSDIDTGFYRLFIDPQNVIFLFLKQGDDIRITTYFPHIARNYDVRNSLDCSILRTMNRRLLATVDTLQMLKDNYHQMSLLPFVNTNSLLQCLNNRAGQLYRRDKAFIVDLINQNQTSPAIYLALYQYFNTQPMFSPESDSAIFQLVLNNLKTHHPTLKQTRFLETSMNRHRLLQQQKTNAKKAHPH